MQAEIREGKCVLGRIKQPINLIAANGWEIRQKFRNRVAAANVIEKILY